MKKLLSLLLCLAMLFTALPAPGAYAEGADAVPGISCENTALTCDLEQSAQSAVPFTLTGELSDRYTLNCDVSRAPFASCRWGDRTGDSIDLIVRFTRAGSGEITVTLYDTREKRELASVTLTVQALENGSPECASALYSDVPAVSNWAHKGIDYCIDHGLMGSTKTDAMTFEPNTKVSRAMVASILYRLDGSPAVTYAGTFTDVKEGKWYTGAVEWAAKNGIAAGKGNGKFDPNGNVTRQELAVFMMKMTEYLGSETAGRADLSRFADAAKVPAWAKTYVQWAVDAGLISGKASGGKTLLAPADTATRAEFASIIMRYMQFIESTKPAEPMELTLQPADAEILPGETAVLTVEVTGGVEPYSYQWYKDGVAVEGETDASFTTGQVGGYYCVVTDSGGGTLTSRTAAVRLREYRPGDTLFFGIYEQDNDPNNGAEQIEWLVLDVDNGSVLVISKYALVNRPFNNSFEDVTWDSCTLRTWLNDEFLNTAFTESQRSKIEERTVPADGNPEYDTDPGSETEDKVFLLSPREAEIYFPSDEERVCYAVASARVNGANTEGDGRCRWWLRSPGSEQHNVAEVIYDGSFDYAADNVSTGDVCVRPAMWIATVFKVTAQPADAEILPGETAVLSVSAFGGVEPYSCQWYRNDKVIEGETGFSITTGQAGDYYCVVTDSGGAAVTTRTAAVCLREYSAGDTLFFGSYEQDNDPADGTEQIEWLVLAVDNGSVLILSKYALDCGPFDEDAYMGFTWGTCSLRSWLNDEFLNAAFTESRRKKIEKRTVPADRNPYFDTDPGGATEDKVFLLSISEAERYRDETSARSCYATAYAKAKGVSADDDGYCNWWLRTPGSTQLNAAYVVCGGDILAGGEIGIYNYGVRPAMWITAALKITAQPADRNILPGGTAVLTVEIAGGNEPYSCQWYKDGDAMEGETAFSCATGEAGEYYCVISDRYGDTVRSETAAVRCSEYTVGDSLLFGSYEQNNDLTDGTEEIEWLILAEDSGSYLVISRYALDCGPINEDVNRGFTWGTCSLRSWLNDEFLNAAFTESQRKKIEKRTVPADRNPYFDTDPGGATEDKVFLLSIPEAEEYFTGAEERVCYATAYAKAKGVYADDAGCCFWWLRTPGSTQRDPAYVACGGGLMEKGIIASTNDGVRPAMWITAALKITAQPADRNILPGGTAVLTVEIAGGNEPYSCQWYKDGAAMEGETAFSCATGEAGDYYCVVTDSSGGTVTTRTAAVRCSGYTVDDSLFFGSYEQNNDLTDGTEEIEWLILAEDSGSYLVISRYALDCGPYNAVYKENVTWKTCSLRKWLNDGFLAAFSGGEQAKIERRAVTVDANSGDTVEDRVFLLSVSEANEYFPSDSEKICCPTAYAVASGAAADGLQKCIWWLRTPGDKSGNAASVGTEGNVFGSAFVNNAYLCVRPALWIKPDASGTPEPLLIETQPEDAGIQLEETAVLSVVAAGGVGPYRYQWYKDGDALDGETASSCVTGQSGGYCCAVTDLTGSTVTSLTAAVYIAGYAVGGTVFFGSYEQDNDLTDGSEEIEWLILAKEENSYLLISRYELEHKLYNNVYAAVTWETCTLRTWLNEDFLNTAFSESQKAMLEKRTVPADTNPDYSTDPGAATEDSVFLLSVREASEYFSSDEARVSYPTAYAKANGASAETDGSAGWWLRTPSSSLYYVANVRAAGYISNAGSVVVGTNLNVRPALWTTMPAPLQVVLRTESAEINFGETAVLSVSAFGGVEPYSCQWYRNGKVIEGETASTCAAGQEGGYYCVVTDSSGSAVTSETAIVRIAGNREYAVGDTLFFGSYEQDNDLNNGAEQIEWLVLAEDSGSYLVISKYALDCRQYQYGYFDVTWENCSLRSWLNDEFLNAAFTESQRRMIEKRTVPADRNPDYDTYPGGAREDNVFLLSIPEANRYFSSDGAGACYPTAYAKAKGADTDGDGRCWWWLRTPGNNQSNAALINSDGVADTAGKRDDEIHYVRPAMWITVFEPLQITAQPADAEILPGRTAVLSVEVSGGIGPYSYRWYRNDAALAGETASSCEVGMLGGYYCVVTGADGGTVTSRTATISIREYAVGDTLFFGSYEQDNDPADGTEQIEWLVLAEDSGSYLVISKYALDRREFNTEGVRAVTWENCSLRSWLNEDFLNDAFTESERAKIEKRTVPADRNPDYDTDPGSATEDKVFLLSIPEANRYFSSDGAGACYPTAYAKAKGANTDDDGRCWWWLRTPGQLSFYATSSRGAGYIMNSGVLASSTGGTVRPAMWIKASLDPLMLTAQSGDMNILPGETAVLSVKVTGGVEPYSYQWYDNGGSALDGENASACAIAQDGARYCVITDSVGNTVTSRSARVRCGGYSVGDTLYFGSYEQDNDLSDGTEQIEWRILAQDSAGYLVISEYGLDSRQFNTDGSGAVTWDTCDLRAWLNGAFLNDAFTESQRTKIEKRTVSADANPDYDIDQGGATEDKVFLLSVPEAKEYFSSNDARVCCPTAYAKAKGANTDSEGRCPWCLRSIGKVWYYVAIVNRSGSISTEGIIFSSDQLCVRPAMWIKKPEQLRLTAQSGDMNILPGETAVLSVKAAGAAEPYRYQWYKDGSVIDGETASSFTTGQEGAYYCVVSEKYGATVRSETVSVRYTGYTVGDTLFFGSYEQDNDLSDGTEQIEWLVLAKTGGSYLVISKYALDSRKFNDSDDLDDKEATVLWEICGLRSWLNGTFLNAAFTESQRKKIEKRTVAADRNPEYDTHPGSATEDKVFLLSIPEAKEYFSSNDARVCCPTAYAAANGTNTDGDGRCWWWLRTPGSNQREAACIYFDGAPLYGGYGVDERFSGVRPAMWINIALQVMSQPGDMNILPGETAVLSVEAAGGDEPYSFQWYKDGDAMEGETAFSCAAGEAGEYYCVVTDSNGGTVTSRTAAISIREYAVGDTLFFGSYEQDNDPADGTEQIEWLVLAEDSGSYLVISRYALDCGPFDEDAYRGVTWGTCSLRSWLNEDFLNDAFTESERAKIEKRTVPADRNPDNDTDPGGATEDKVFLLSISETERYRSDISTWSCYATAYAKAKGVSADDDGRCWWWLRTPGHSQINAADVDSGGGIETTGVIGNAIYGIRPAMWIKAISPNA